jgi:hypothetical protein
MRTTAFFAAATAAIACSTAAAQVPLSLPPEKMNVHTPESLAKAVAEREAKANEGKPAKAKPKEDAPAAPTVSALDPGAPNTAEGRFLPKWVLLRSGHLDQRDIMKDAAGYLWRKFGASGRFSFTEVVAVVDTKADVYKYKRNRIADNDLSERMELANWCLRHVMVEEATEEAKAVLKIDPKNAKAIQFLKRLQSEEGRQKAAAEGGSAPGGGGNLAGDAAGFGDDALNMFTKNIQLILMNKCGNCHANPRHEGAFQLASTKRPNPASTSRNFKAAESFVDLKNPSRSKLLEMALTPHGGVKSGVAPFAGPNDVAFKNLRKWTITLAKNWHEAFAQPDDMPFIANDDLPDWSIRRPTAAPPKKNTAVASKMKPAPDQPGFTSAAADDAPPPRPSLMNAPKKKAAAPKVPEGDPLDPDDFNKKEVGETNPPPERTEPPKPSQSEAPKPSKQEAPKPSGAAAGDLHRDLYDGVPASWKKK